MLHLHLSNRPSTLASALGELQRQKPLPLLETEAIVVPSTAIARWLEFRLADHLGIAVQLGFHFPAAFAWQLFGRVLPGLARSSPFDRQALQWRLMRLLQTHPAAAVAHYLTDDDGRKCHGLAQRLAALFERYLVDRPDWIATWISGKLQGLGPDEVWQAQLWRRLIAELPDVSKEHPRDRFLGALATDPHAHARLPARISLFACEAMPTLYWELFVSLARWVDIHVYALSPSREYWGDIDRLRRKLRMEIDNPAAADLLEIGHPLLASLGRGRQHAFVRLSDATSQVSSREEVAYVEPAETLLGRLQRDILDLDSSTGIAVDDTLQIHACHGALREAEVLHDRLLALFEAMPDLRLSDVLILTPDIATYGPVIEAVLTHAEASRRLPCSVADRPLEQSVLWRAMRQLLRTLAGEFDAESVMSLLEIDALRRAFGIEGDEISLLRDWVVEAGIRCGLDRQSRDYFDHTWSAGLERLLLGVALPDEERLWHATLPVPGVEGSRANVLGRFIDLVEVLSFFAPKVGAGRTAQAWCALLSDMLARFFLPDEVEELEAQRIREVLASLSERVEAAACQVSLPLTTLADEVDTLLAERSSARAFQSGRITVAALQPGRPLAARVICCVGMNDGAWPRPVVPLSFDLIATHPRPGDRLSRDEERQAFLEMLLCAEDRLILTFTGNDPRTNAAFPPAAPLAELIDVVTAMTGRAAKELITKHPLQPFSRVYFDDQHPGLFSFDVEACPAIHHEIPQPFIPPDFRIQHAEPVSIELQRVHQFFANPSRYFIRERMGIHLEESEELLEVHEPFNANRLDAYRLREACFAAMQAGADDRETAEKIKAGGLLPHGLAGELALREAREEAGSVFAQARAWIESAALPPQQISFASTGATLTGQLDGLSVRGLWRVRHGKTRARDRLRLWVDHLLLQTIDCAALNLSMERTSVLFAQDGCMQLSPLSPDEAAARLGDLLMSYREGLCSPLPFYPETAWAWLEGKSGWHNAWSGGNFQRAGAGMGARMGERDDAYVRLVLRDRSQDPLGEAFQSLASRIFEPLRDALSPCNPSAGEMDEPHD